MKVASTDYKVAPLRKVMTMYPPERLTNIISSFSCERNKDVESFLKEKAIVQEKKHISRTYLIFTNDRAAELVAYFTVAISSMDVAGLECSNELRKKMNINNNLAQSYLIGQIGKRDGSQKGLGRSAMLCAIELIKGTNLKAGCRVIRLDCKPSLVRYYADNGFLVAGKSRDGSLHQMVRIISAGSAAPSA
jgi:hypothetical protein